MANIGNLWVKLGLKSDDFSKGLNQAASKTKSFGSEAGKTIGGLVAKFTSVTTAIAAVTKFVKDSIAMTQKWGDAWQIEMSGMQSAYGTFVRQLSSGDGWKDLISNMRESYRVGKEVAAALDEIFERKVSFSYTSAETDKYISEQQLIMRDASKSDEERMKAAQNIINAETELAEKKKNIWAYEAEQYRKKFRDQTELEDDQIDYLLKQYEANREVINQARDYNTELEKAEKYLKAQEAIQRRYGNSAAADQAREQVKALKDGTSEAVKSVAEMVKNYDKSSDELVSNMVDAEIAVINIETEMNRASTRATAMLGSLKESSLRQSSSAPAVSTSGNGLADVGAAFANAEAIAAEKARENAEAVREWKDALNELDDVIKTDQEDLQAFLDANQDGLIESLKQNTFELNELVSGAMTSAVNGFSDAIQEMFDALMSGEELDMSTLTATLLTPLCDMAKQMGEVMMTMAAAEIALQGSIANPYALLAAGAALVAIGAAGKAALSAITSGSSATSTTTTGTSTAAATTSSAELTVYVKGTIKGSDILISGQNTMTEWNK